jgi:hypothetical protein
MVPPPLRTLRALRTLNVAAVGLSLGAIVGVAFQKLLAVDVAPVTALTTLLVGTLWAALLRSRRRVLGGRFPIGWALSPVLASANAALALGALLGSEKGLPAALLGALFGATIGGSVWVPALLATLAIFGWPLHRARTLAERGLAGEERGEAIAGAASTFIGAVALAIEIGADGPRSGTVCVLGLLGLLSGATAAGLAFAREARRRAFVGRVEAGEEPGYRVDLAREGKVLVRVTSNGQGYRVADFEERIAELGAENEVIRAVR